MTFLKTVMVSLVLVIVLNSTRAESMEHQRNNDSTIGRLVESCLEQAAPWVISIGAYFLVKKTVTQSILLFLDDAINSHTILQIGKRTLNLVTFKRAEKEVRIIASDCSKIIALSIALVVFIVLEERRNSHALDYED